MKFSLLLESQLGARSQFHTNYPGLFTFYVSGIRRAVCTIIILLVPSILFRVPLSNEEELPRFKPLHLTKCSLNKITSPPLEEAQVMSMVLIPQFENHRTWIDRFFEHQKCYSHPCALFMFNVYMIQQTGTCVVVFSQYQTQVQRQHLQRLIIF